VKNYNYPLYRAMRKYGIENFTFEVLCECSATELNKKETYYIEYYNSLYDGYNQTNGGDSGYSAHQLEYSQNIKYDLLNTSLTYDDLVEKYNISKQSLSAINNGRVFKDDKLSYPLRDFSSKEFYCIDCGVKISSGCKYCISCAHYHQRIVERPNAKELAQEIVETNFCAVGRKYGVSDNAIRKWCKSYGLPTKKQDLEKWLEEFK
jgi:hypothetical protein